YRGGANTGFARLWTGTIASLALAAPPAVEVQVDPPLASPGDPIVIRVAVRKTEMTSGDADLTIPVVGASIVDADGVSQPVRLWPEATPGLFEARLPAPPSGRYDIQAAIQGAQSDTALLVRTNVRHPPALDDDATRLVV